MSESSKGGRYGGRFETWLIGKFLATAGIFDSDRSGFIR
jgi:hypothetical protein